MAEKILAIEDVSFRYNGGDAEAPPAVRGVSLAAEQGEFIAVVGHNGSGKSTLAKMINGLYLPTEGRVLVKGMDTKDEAHVWDVRQCAGLVLQNPDNQLVATIVEEDVAFGPENLGMEPIQIRKRVNDALAAVGMLEFAQSAPHMLSGGQKQRVAIAGILAMKPDLLVLDEPTAMLDPQGRREVLETVLRLNREEGITVLLITHYMEEAYRADRVVVMDEGRVIMEGAPRSIFSRVREMKQAGLDVPAMTELADMLRQAGMDLPADIMTVEEMEVALCPLLSRA